MTELEVFEKAYALAKEIGPKYKADPFDLARHMTGIAKVESNYNPDAKNKSSTARGMMQLLICTQREIEKKMAKVPLAPAMYSCKVYPTPKVSQSEDKIFDPDYALEIALYYLAYQYKRYGNWLMAVHAYNQGSFTKTAAGKY